MKFDKSGPFIKALNSKGYEGEIIFGGKSSRSRGESAQEFEDRVTHILPNPVDREKSLRNTDDSLLQNTDGGTLKNTEG